MQESQPWFVAGDVCDVFGEKNRYRAMQFLEEDEKGYTQIETSGGRQSVAIVSESGLYSMLFAMQPTKARGVSDAYIQERADKLRTFKRWITHEVIPDIRRYGIYATETTVSELFDNPDRFITLLEKYRSQKSSMPGNEITPKRLTS
jgi:prophage antirepressor-like protein